MYFAQGSLTKKTIASQQFTQIDISITTYIVIVRWICGVSSFGAKTMLFNVCQQISLF